MEKLRGTGVALITPFTDKGEFDKEALTRLVEHCHQGGVEYLVVMGTTGENPVLTPGEKTAVRQHVVEVNQGRLPLVYGVGSNNTASLVKELKDSDFTGIDAILSVSPYYNKPTQEGLYQHYQALSEASPLPIVLYNVPGRTGSNIAAGTTLRLAHDFENIIGIKEASGDMEQVMQIIAGRPDGFLVISGEDNLTLPIIACGGDGVISVTGQAFPRVYSDMVRAALANRMDEARIGHYRLFEVTKMLFAEGNPGGVKAALQTLRICGDHMRQPLWPVSDSLRKAIAQEIDRWELE